MPNATTPVMVQGDREIYSEDIDHICIVLQRFPGLPRKEVALILCETLNWLTPAGRPKLDACFKLLQRYHPLDWSAPHPGSCPSPTP